MPFRTAHETVGNAVLYAISEGKELHELRLEQLREFSPDIETDVADALSLDATLANKSQTGGTSRQRVAEALKAAKQHLKI